MTKIDFIKYRIRVFHVGNLHEGKAHCAVFKARHAAFGHANHGSISDVQWMNYAVREGIVFS